MATGRAFEARGFRQENKQTRIQSGLHAGPSGLHESTRGPIGYGGRAQLSRISGYDCGVVLRTPPSHVWSEGRGMRDIVCKGGRGRGRRDLSAVSCLKRGRGAMTMWATVCRYVCQSDTDNSNIPHVDSLTPLNAQ